MRHIYIYIRDRGIKWVETEMKRREIEIKEGGETERKEER